MAQSSADRLAADRLPYAIRDVVKGLAYPTRTYPLRLSGRWKKSAKEI